jgi:nitroreductase
MLNVDPGVVERVLQGGLRAPSAHNAQPWRLARIGDATFRLTYAYADRLLADPDDRDGLLAIGGFYETLRLAAEAESLEAEFTPTMTPATTGLELGMIAFRPLARPPDPLALAVAERRCNRHAYERSPLAPDLGARLEALGNALLPPAAVAPLVQRASAMSWQDARFVADIRTWTRLDPAAPDGMTVESLQINRLDYVGLRFVLTQRRLPAILARIYAARDVRLTRASSAMAVLTVEGRDPLTLFEAGQRLVRSWVTINAAGWSWHPMSVVIDQPTAAELRLMIGGADPVAIYRVGRTDAPASRSGRRSLAAILSEPVPPGRSGAA